MRVVVLTGAVLDIAARMTALDLDRGVADVKAVAQPLFEVAHDVLGVP